MPNVKPLTTHGLNFEQAMKRMIATPPLPKSKKGNPTGKIARFKVQTIVTLQ
jgi:hypothetical protein